MAQYGRPWWALLAVIAGLLVGLIFTYPSGVELTDDRLIVSRPRSVTDGYCSSFLGADIAALRGELTSFSDQPFTVTAFGNVPIEVRVLAEGQAEFVREVVGKDADRLVDIVVGDDLGLAIPDERPPRRTPSQSRMPKSAVALSSGSSSTRMAAATTCGCSRQVG